jgi:aryl-alcohol dehydrogenase-like predicted oxidoreductase
MAWRAQSDDGAHLERKEKDVHYRELGGTGLQVSEIGYGAWGIGGTGWVGADDAESLTALNRAIDLGLNFIDTALAYGDGHSESLVGRVARQRGEEIYIATKVPPKNRQWPPRPGVGADEAFPAEHIVACTEESLRNLGLERIDVQQFHVWSSEWLEQGDWLEAVRSLKDEGKIRYFGVSINDRQPDSALSLVESGNVDTVQVIYNIFDQSAEDALFPACLEHGVGVIGRVPLDEGGLTGQVKPSTVFPVGDFRNQFFRGDRKREVQEHVERVLSDLGISEDQLPEVALRYALSHPAVSTIIPGMRSVRNVERNCAAGDGTGLSSDQLKRLKAHRWARNFAE